MRYFNLTSCFFVLILLFGSAIFSANAQKMRDYPVLKELQKEGYSFTKIKAVYSIQEFIEALDNNTVIIVKPGDYTFTDSDILGEDPEDEWSGVDDFGALSDFYDETYIENIHDLAIIGELGGLERNSGADEDRPRFIQPDGYNHVMKFMNVENLFMQNLFLGHDTPGYCMGGVLLVHNGVNIRLDNIVFSGSGTEGLSLIDVETLRVTNSLITESSEQLSSFSNVVDAVFENCVFKDNEITLRGFAIYYSEIKFINTEIDENQWPFYHNPYEYTSDYDELFYLDDYDFGEWYVNREEDPFSNNLEGSYIEFEECTINEERASLIYDLTGNTPYDEGAYEDTEEYEEFYEQEYEDEPRGDSVHD